MDSGASKQTSLKHSGRTNDTLMTLELLSSQPKLWPHEKKKKKETNCLHGHGWCRRRPALPRTAVVSFRFCIKTN